MKIALLIVDMQIEFLQDQPVAAASEYINHTAQILRSGGHQVIHIQDVEGAEDEEDAVPERLRFIPEIVVEQDDLVVKKTFSNAFWQTDLERILLDREIGLVVVAGFDAGNCVLFTYNGAIERGFKTAILHRGIMSSREDLVLLTYRDRHVVSYPVIEFMVQS
ncbi:cysteine hydrolase family protein [Paenibacillus sp. UNC499MF]|uniref:cysteine hydrolase family protein n=1 Tax=Paenibacillus sp. UNC499MF TaxID=1502751 RepID=UPI00089F95B3|nr:isochorismatase family cysteine hydrolase [Paenibacillus sp. UNC499MF]SEG71985.1 Nicotinamidase-related amidase [Paenibacillus sp. UNC499MF]